VIDEEAESLFACLTEENVELPENTRFISIKENVIFRLIGRFVTDWSIDSATGLFDIKEYHWDRTCYHPLVIQSRTIGEFLKKK
jgi:sugar (pentulose or hexulose) kinase